MFTIHFIRLLALMSAALALSSCSLFDTISEQPDRETEVPLIEALTEHGIDGLRDAALADEPEALRLLAACYRHGMAECGYDIAAAQRYLEQAIASGSVRAKTDLCEVQMEALPDTAGQAEALTLCRQARDEGDASATVVLARYALGGNEEAERILPDSGEALRAQVDAGNAQAMRQLALALDAGKLGESDPEGALAMVEDAIAAGSERARVNRLFWLMREDADDAAFQAALDETLESPIAQLPEMAAWIGYILVRAEREDEGFAIMEEASDAQVPTAQALLAFSIQADGASQRNGRNVSDLLESASEGNSPTALTQLALGAAQSRDYERALRLAERAAISGQSDALAMREAIRTDKAEYDRRQAQLREAAAAFARRESAPGGVRIPASATTAQRSCRRTGFGPGNSVTCGPYADTCEKTGFGPGNDVACGGLATRCEKTGFGPGNDVACGGLSSQCEKTGFGEGNRVSCGGLSSRCEKTGFGPGNDVSCGGKSARCEKTGFGPGNDVSCGGLATRCERTGYGRGNREACGGLARRR